MRPSIHLLDPRHPFDGVAVEMPVNGSAPRLLYEKYKPGHGIPTGQFDRRY